MNINKFTKNKSFLLIILAIIILFLYLLIIKIHRTYSDSFYIDYTDVKNALKPSIIQKTKLPLNTSDNSYTYSLWLYLNDWNYKHDEIKHIFHIGDKNANVTSPGVWFDKLNNNLLIACYTHHSNRHTTGELTKNKSECIFPYKWSYSKLGVKKPCNLTPELKEMGFGKVSDIPDTIKIYNCETTVDKYSSTGYCPMKVNNKGYVENITDFGVCNSSSMNPIENNSFNKDPSICTIKNIPLKQWFHLVISIEGNHMNIYINGSLSRTHVFNSQAKLTNNDLFINHWGGFDGAISQFYIYPFASNIKTIKNIYRKGPDKSNNLFDFIKSIDKNICQLCD